VNLEELRHLVGDGESEKLELKKSTGDLKGGLETLCAFLNANGGKVLFGVTAGGRIRGQNVTDNTVQEIARELRRLEPAADVLQMRVPVSADSEVIVLETAIRSDAPYTYRGRPYRRIGTTTSLMPQTEYERRLLERGHSPKRFSLPIRSAVCEWPGSRERQRRIFWTSAN